MSTHAKTTKTTLLRRGMARTATTLAGGALVATGMLATGTAANAASGWDDVAACESGGDWSINTGNGFGGGLQFTDSTWRAFGGSGQPEDASRSEQIQVAERVKAEQGMNAWPTCSKKTGNTDSSANTESDSGSSSSSDSESSDSSDSEGVRSSASTEKPAQPVAPAAPGAGHTVAAGETLSSIAAANGVSWQSVAQRNALADPDSLSVGQQLALR